MPNQILEYKMHMATKKDEKVVQVTRNSSDRQTEGQVYNNTPEISLGSTGIINHDKDRLSLSTCSFQHHVMLSFNAAVK